MLENFSQSYSILQRLLECVGTCHEFSRCCWVFGGCNPMPGLVYVSHSW